MRPETRSAPRRSRGPAALGPVELDAGTLMEAYAAIDIQLAPEAALLDASVDELAAESPVRRAGREAAVAGAATEVIALTRETAAGRLASAAQTAEAGAARAVADDSLVEAVDALVFSWGRWQDLAQTALASLATAQRIVAVRALARFECLADEGFVRHRTTEWGPERDFVNASTSPCVGAQVEWVLDLFAHPDQHVVGKGTTAVDGMPSPHLLRGLAVREGEAEAEEWIELLADLWECELTVAGHARSLQHSWARIDQLRRNVLAGPRHEHAGPGRRARTRRFIGRESCRRRSPAR